MESFLEVGRMNFTMPKLELGIKDAFSFFFLLFIIIPLTIGLYYFGMLVKAINNIATEFVIKINIWHS